jgi:hypothetical protein
MEEQQQSSSSTVNDIDRNNFDFDNQQPQLPVVDALTTPNPGIRSTLAHMATVTKLQETEQRIKHQATYIQELARISTSPPRGL